MLSSRFPPPPISPRRSNLISSCPSPPPPPCSPAGCDGRACLPWLPFNRSFWFSLGGSASRSACLPFHGLAEQACSCRGIFTLPFPVSPSLPPYPPPLLSPRSLGG